MTKNNINTDTSESLSIGQIDPDSDKIENIENKQKFPVQFQHIPGGSTLRIIVSDWRFPTTVKGTQGDHVIAYTLILHALLNLEGEYIRETPKLFYNRIIKTLIPDSKDNFKAIISDMYKEVKEYKTKRDASVTKEKKAENKDYLNSALKVAEYNLVTNCLQKISENFVSYFNAMEGEAFASGRKEGAITFAKKIMKKEAETRIDKKKFPTFRKELLDSIESLTKITDTEFTKISKTLIPKLTGEKIPDQFIGERKKITIEKLTDFLKDIAVLKKQEESHATTGLNDANEYARLHSKVINNKSVGKLCAMLFDYPKVGNNPRTGEVRDDLDVLCQAIPRLIITTFTAFKHLQKLNKKDKEIIYDTVLDQILEKQLWKFHKITNSSGVKVCLRESTLKDEINNFAVIEFSNQGNDELRMLSQTEKDLREEAKRKAEEEAKRKAKEEDKPKKKKAIKEKVDNIPSSKPSKASARKTKTKTTSNGKGSN